MQNFSRSLLFVLVCVLMSCGRYMPPVAPENLAPAVVDDATATGDAKGVLTLEWRAPHNDIRGKKLKEIVGYSVSRWVNNQPYAITDNLKGIVFEQIAFIEDHHLEELKKLEDEAEDKGQISRKKKVDEAAKKFTYTDTAVPQGTSFYKITPINDAGGEGNVKDLYKVTRVGDVLTIVILPYTLNLKPDA